MRLKNVRQRYADALSVVSWQDFERLIGTYYAAQGYRVEHVGTASSRTKFDGGIDLKLYRGDQYLIVQCKHWNARQLPHNPVHELLGVMLTEHATGAIVVTSGEFTRAAHSAAAKEPRVQLIDGAVVRGMLGPWATAAAPKQVQSSAYPPDMQFNRPWQRSRRSRKRNPLPGIVLAVVAALLVMLVIRHAVTDMTRKLSPHPAVLVVPTTGKHPATRSDPIHRPARTTPDYMQGVPTTEEEMREWKRRNAESMKILEKTTPEMPLR